MWKFINSPIAVAIVVLVCLPLTMTFSGKMFAKGYVKESVKEISDILFGKAKETNTVVREIIEAFTNPFSDLENKGNKKKLEKLKLKENILISDIKFAQSSWKTKERVIGKITNNTKYVIETNTVIVSYFNNKGELIDTTSGSLHDVEGLNPGQSISFEVERDIGSYDDSDTKLRSRKAVSANCVLGRFDILDKED